MLLNCHQVFAPFLDCLHSFGFKTSEDDHVWNGFRRSVSSRIGQGQPEEVHYGPCLSQRWYLRRGSLDMRLTSIQPEFCYAVRYVARNERSSGSPWSLRQTAVYHQYNASTNNSTWIFLQPSTIMQRRYTDTQQSVSLSCHPAALHVVLLFAIAADWKDYISYLRQEIDILVCRPPSHNTRFLFF